jgi:uncharacterized protein (TIGR02271 family)
MGCEFTPEGRVRIESDHWRNDGRYVSSESNINHQNTMPNMDENTRGRDTNPDPITGAPGAHPVGVGIGAAGGGATGAAIGTAVAGPIGTAVGAVIGAVAGGLAGKSVAEGIDPTAEDAYWRDAHNTQPYAQGRTYDEFAPAYRTGYEGFTRHSSEAKRFEDAEPKLRADYESHLSSSGTGMANRAKLGWEEAKHAAKAAWSRVERGEAVRVPITEEQVAVGKREVEGGAVRLRKEVHTETVNTPVTLRREEVIVERVAPGTPGAVPDDAFTEGEIRVPLKQEEAVVQKTAHVTGEVRLRKNVEHETQNVQETIRKEEVHVENEGQARVRDDRSTK